MKTFRFFLALSLVITFFSSCSENDNDNYIFATKSQSNDLATVDEGKIKIYKEVKQIEVDSSLLQSSEKASEACLNPGKTILVKKDKTVRYTAESFWTKQLVATNSKFIYYDEKQSKFIKSETSKTQERTDFIPISLFLILFILIVINTLGHDDQNGSVILYGFTIVICALAVVICVAEGQSFFGAFANTVFEIIGNLAAWLISAIIIGKLGANKIPLLNKRTEAAMIIALALACAIRFSFFAELHPKYLYLVFLFFLLPNIITWLYMIARHIIKIIKAGKEKLNKEKTNEQNAAK